MGKKNISVPKLDLFIQHAQHSPILQDSACIEMLIKISGEMDKLEIQGDDELRSIWLEANRGTIADFGSYAEYKKEGEVSNKKEFIELWEVYYPDKIKWYKLSVTKYDNEIYFYLDSKLTFHIKPENDVENDKCLCGELIEWLLEEVKNTIITIENNASEYNEHLNKNLPFRKRLGRIVRSDYWSLYAEEMNDFRKGISEESVKILSKIVKQSKQKPNFYLEKINSGDFFNFCEIAYHANDYFDEQKKAMNPKEKYLTMADGRDCGLRNINENSDLDFLDWYNNKSHCGGHPWEICRGGNSTHISLSVQKSDEGWYLRLAGSSRVRVIETVRMVVALYQNNIPLILESAEEIFRMITGIDYIGIVPDTVFPGYCHGLFPNADKIIDFMNLGTECTNEFIQKVHWYPLKEVRLK